MTNQVEVIQPQTPLQPEEISEVHVRNPNYNLGKNYDPNFQAKHAEAAHTASHNNKQPQQASTVANQYKPTYNKPASMYNNSNSNAPLTSSSDIVGEVTLKTSVDGYQLLKVNEMIKMLSHGEQGCQKRVSFQNILITALRKVPRYARTQGTH